MAWFRKPAPLSSTKAMGLVAGEQQIGHLFDTKLSEIEFFFEFTSERTSQRVLNILSQTRLTDRELFSWAVRYHESNMELPVFVRSNPELARRLMAPEPSHLNFNDWSFSTRSEEPEDALAAFMLFAISEANKSLHIEESWPSCGVHRAQRALLLPDAHTSLPRSYIRVIAIRSQRLLSLGGMPLADGTVAEFTHGDAIHRWLMAAPALKALPLYSLSDAETMYAGSTDALLHSLLGVHNAEHLLPFLRTMTEICPMMYFDEFDDVAQELVRMDDRQLNLITETLKSGAQVSVTDIIRAVC